MKNFSDTTGNLTRDLPVCSSVSQATASQSGLHPTCKEKDKAKIIPLQAWTDLEYSCRLRLPDFKIIGT